jgi:hypothetical protein
MFLLDVIILLKNRMKIMSENKTTEIDGMKKFLSSPFK